MIAKKSNLPKSKFNSKGYQNQQIVKMKNTTNKLLEGLYDITQINVSVDTSDLVSYFSFGTMFTKEDSSLAQTLLRQAGIVVKQLDQTQNNQDMWCQTDYVDINQGQNTPHSTHQSHKKMTRD